MNENNSIRRFRLSAPSIWPLIHLVAEEDGPWNLITHLQSRFGGAKLVGKLDTGVLDRLVNCFYYVSLWIALSLAVFTCNGWLGLVASNKKLKKKP